MKSIKMSFKLLLPKFPVNIFFIFLLKSTVTTAQLYNDSGTIRIMKGSSVVCMGSFTNAGTITNDGKLEVRGNFNNSDKYSSTLKEDTLLLTGAGNVTLKSGLATLNNLQVNKTNGGGVTLTSNTTISSTFDLLEGDFSTDPSKSYELIAPASATFAFGPSTYITGKVRRTNWVNGRPVIFHQPDMIVTTNVGSAPTNLLVNMVPDKDPTASEREVKRYFYFSPVGGSNYTADITFPYSPAELNTNNEAHLIAWYYDQSNKWKQKLTGNTNNPASHYVISAGIRASILANREWKLAEMQYESKNSNLFVFPIPAKTTMNIVIAAEKNKKVTIELVDVSGKVCKMLQKDIQKGLNKLSLNVTGLSSGQYIVKVEEGGTVQTKVVLID